MRLIVMILIMLIAILCSFDGVYGQPPPPPPDTGMLHKTSIGPSEDGDSGDDEIYIDKTTSKYTYNKGEYILVQFNIFINKKPSTRIYNIYIYEDISNAFDVVGTHPTGEKLTSGQIRWYFKDISDLISTSKSPRFSDGYLEYIIKTEEIDEYTLGVTKLEAERKPRDDQESHIEILYPSTKINIINNPPIIEHIEYPETPVWYGDEFSIRVILSDLDNDNITSKLWLNGCAPLNQPNRTSDGNKTYYTWNLSNYNPGIYAFVIEADDGDDTKRSDYFKLEIQKKLLGFLPISNEYKWPIIIGGFIAGMVAGISGKLCEILIYRKK